MFQNQHLGSGFTYPRGLQKVMFRLGSVEFVYWVLLRSWKLICFGER